MSLLSLYPIFQHGDPGLIEIREKSQCESLGPIFQVCLEKILAQNPDAVLFWDDALGVFDSQVIFTKLSTPIDIYHAGLCLGMNGQPEFLNYVNPTWMLNCDADPQIESSSWRLSFRACLVRTEVFRQLGGPRKEFNTLDAAGLEMGLRFIRAGVRIRHSPQLLGKCTPQMAVSIPIHEQLQLIHSIYGKKWSYWAGFRSVMNRKAAISEAFHMLKRITRQDPPPQSDVFARQSDTVPIQDKKNHVTVLIPTLNRYSYLRKLLEQLEAQTLPPLEVLIIDQTPLANRDKRLVQDFPNLPVRLFQMDKAGQCSARNLGLSNSKGELILFLDDDDEIQPDLIERHLRNLVANKVRVSNGNANEVGAEFLDDSFRKKRISDVFSTNNTMIYKDVLQRSGLFDQAYDTGQRADLDLGMRIYLAGEVMLLDPEISVLHHHAPSGGLREHKARVTTYAASRRSLFRHSLPSISDLYLWQRYFFPKQFREIIWISFLGTFSHRGKWWQKGLKILFSSILFPVRLMQYYKRKAISDILLLSYPDIPELGLEDSA